MMRRLLLCSDGSSYSVVAMEYAFWLAKRLSAHVVGIHVSDIRLLEWPLLADLSGSIGAQPYQAALPHIQQYQKDKAGVILASIKDTAQKRGIACATLHKTGTLADSILEAEKDADLVVLGQRGEHAEQTGDMIGSSIERILRRSTKPCLVTPGKFQEITRVLLAYDGSNHAGRALKAGLYFASTLSLPVTLVTVEGDDSMAASTHLDEAVTQAKKQGVEVQSHLLQGDPETAILKAAETQNASLIVMGAYGHNRIREFILGSTTSHVIRKSRVPVLLTR